LPAAGHRPNLRGCAAIAIASLRINKLKIDRCSKRSEYLDGLGKCCPGEGDREGDDPLHEDLVLFQDPEGHRAVRRQAQHLLHDHLVGELPRLLAEADGLAAAPGRDEGARGLVDAGDVGGLEPRGGDEGEEHAPDLAVALAGDHQRGGLAEDGADGAGVAALEQALLVVQHEVVELLVARHDRRRAEQVRLEHRPVLGDVLLQEAAGGVGRVGVEEADGLADEGPAEAALGEAMVAEQRKVVAEHRRGGDGRQGDQQEHVHHPGRTLIDAVYKTSVEN